MATGRFEVLLPAQFNDGRDAMRACMAYFPATLMDVVGRFGTVAHRSQPPKVARKWHEARSSSFRRRQVRRRLDHPRRTGSETARTVHCGLPFERRLRVGGVANEHCGKPAAETPATVVRAHGLAPFIPRCTGSAAASDQ